MYNAIKNINKLKFNEKKVLLIGAGYMAEQYCMALSAMGIRNVTVCSRTEQSAKKCSQKYRYHPVHGGYELCLPQLGTFDLVIIATPVHDLMPAPYWHYSMAIEISSLKNLHLCTLMS